MPSEDTGLPAAIPPASAGKVAVRRAIQANFDHIMGQFRAISSRYNRLLETVGEIEDVLQGNGDPTAFELSATVQELVDTVNNTYLLQGMLGVPIPPFAVDRPSWVGDYRPPGGMHKDWDSTQHQQRPVYDVRAFGARPDIADNTVQVQGAIDAANAGGGGVVFFPVGIFPVGSPIHSYAGVVFRGSVAGPSILRYTGTGATTFLTLSGASPANLGTEHLRIDYTAAGFTGRLVDFTPSAGTTSRVWMTDTILQGQSAASKSSSVLLTLDTCVNVWLEKTQFGFADVGIQGATTAGHISNMVHMRDCVFGAIGVLNIVDIKNPVEAWVEEGCTFEAVGAASNAGGLLVEAGFGAFVQGLSFLGCWFGDVAAGQTGAWISLDGGIVGFSVIGGRMSVSTAATGVLFTGNGVLGQTILGVGFIAPSGAPKCVDYGATTGHKHAIVLGNDPGVAGVMVSGTLPTIDSIIDDGTKTNVTDVAPSVDNTVGDVSTTRHGWVPKAPGGLTQFFRGDGKWGFLPPSPQGFDGRDGRDAFTPPFPGFGTMHGQAAPGDHTHPGGSGVNVNSGLVDFGAAETDVATVTIAAAWVGAGSIIACQVAAVATADHGAEDAVVEGLVAYPTNIVPGVGFDVEVFAPLNTWGKYTVWTVGA